MAGMTLRTAILDLANKQPDLRKHLLPLLDGSSRVASRITMSPGVEKPDLTKQLQAMKKLPARSKGDLGSSLMVGGNLAQKMKKTMFVFQGNSYGSSVWHIADKASRYLDPISNTGKELYSVSPELVVKLHTLSNPLHQMFED